METFSIAEMAIMVQYIINWLFIIELVTRNWEILWLIIGYHYQTTWWCMTQQYDMVPRDPAVRHGTLAQQWDKAPLGSAVWHGAAVPSSETWHRSAQQYDKAPCGSAVRHGATGPSSETWHPGSTVRQGTARLSSMTWCRGTQQRDMAPLGSAVWHDAAGSSSETWHRSAQQYDMVPRDPAARHGT